MYYTSYRRIYRIMSPRRNAKTYRGLTTYTNAICENGKSFSCPLCETILLPKALKKLFSFLPFKSSTLLRLIPGKRILEWRTKKQSSRTYSTLFSKIHESSQTTATNTHRPISSSQVPPRFFRHETHGL